MCNEYVESVDCSIIPRDLTFYTQKWHIICQIFTYFLALLSFIIQVEVNRTWRGVEKEQEEEDENCRA